MRKRDKSGTTTTCRQTVGSFSFAEKATVRVLIEGYARQVENGWVASSTTCLVISSGMKIITDPGCNRQKLLDALSKENLSADDIDFVFLSHGHPDHILLAGIFANARQVTYDDDLVYDQDRMVKFDKHILGPHTEVIHTPGHVPDHISLLVDTSEGVVAIAGDVFWWPDGEKQDPGALIAGPFEPSGLNREMLAQSRSQLLKTADLIIPGHGKMFRGMKGKTETGRNIKKAEGRPENGEWKPEEK
ncbi:MAG: MBL fold metallo-hydrolase [Mangrovibacterium sp.]|nr:MBL fold metallo-hydrolase [Mangrovibacterium sp.]